jgi:hypothetical protein
MVSPRRNSRRQWILAWSLLVGMVAAFASTGHWLHSESTRFCEALAVEPEAMGRSTLPCRSRTLSEQGALVSETMYFYDQGSRQLSRIETRTGAEIERIDCSFAGKLVLPFVHWQKWMSLGVSQSMNASIDAQVLERGATKSTRRQVVTSEDGTKTEVVETVLRDDKGDVEWSDRRVYDAAGVLLERVHSSGVRGDIRRSWRHELDEAGNVRRRDVEQVIFDQVSRSVTYYDYGCAD